MRSRFKRLAKRMLPGGMLRQLERQRLLQRFGAGYLDPKGWFVSARGGQSVDHDREPVPWITYPARELLERVIRPSSKLFEYGSGNSSLWWSKRVSRVAVVEHDPQWAQTIRDKAPTNLSVALREKGESAPAEYQSILDSFLAACPDLPSTGDPRVDIAHGLNCTDFGAYALEPAIHGKGYFDIFVIDGMARSLCASVAAQFVANEGLIIFDNSDRWQYNPGFGELGRRGWKRIDFYGPGPVVSIGWCTSIFCRNLDWLSPALTLPVPAERPSAASELNPSQATPVLLLNGLTPHHCSPAGAR